MPSTRPVEVGARQEAELEVARVQLTAGVVERDAGRGIAVPLPQLPVNVGRVEGVFAIPAEVGVQPVGYEMVATPLEPPQEHRGGRHRLSLLVSGLRHDNRLTI